MTDNQINAAIAEACGWTDFVVHPQFGLMGASPDTRIQTAVDWYTVDLNAMHEAEKVLNTETQFMNYYLALYDVTQKTRWPVSATARQRAEAFLRTLGKWRATDKESLTVGAATTEQSSVDQKEALQ